MALEPQQQDNSFGTTLLYGAGLVIIVAAALLLRPIIWPNSQPNEPSGSAVVQTTPSLSPSSTIIGRLESKATNTAVQSPASDAYSLTFASDRDGTFDVYLMDPEHGTWKKLNRPTGYDVAIWPSFCENEIAAELHDTRGIKAQWVYLFDPDSGNATPWNTTGGPSELGVPRCSPGGQFLAYSENLNSKWLMKIDTFPQGNNNLTISNYPTAGYTSWFWDTQDMLYMIYRAGTFRILRMQGMDPNQTGDVSPASTQDGNEIDQWEFPAISPDGLQMAFLCQVGSQYWLCVTNMSTGKTNALQRIQFVNTRWDKWSIISAGTPVWSRDGTWIYFSSADEGNFDIYRIHSDGSGKQNITSTWASNEIMPNMR